MRIYLDTNVFIAAIEEAPSTLQNALLELFELSEARQRLLVTSELTLAELLVKPLEENLSALASTYCDWFEHGRHLAVAPVDRAVLVAATSIRARDRAIKLPDAIHLATADREGCSVIVSDDRRLTANRPQHCRPISVEAIIAIVRELS